MFGTGAGQVSTMAELSTALAGAGRRYRLGRYRPTAISSITASGNNTITIGGTANPLTFGMHTTSALPSNQEVVAQRS